MGKRIEASDVPVSIPFNALEKGKDSRVVRDQTGAKAAGGLPRKAGSRCRVGTNLLESRVSFCKVAIFSTAAARRERITTSRHRCLSFFGTSFL